MFVANISHEIRTPLSAIIGVADLLHESPLDSHQKHYVKTIQKAGQGLLTIVNDVLDLSKIEASKLDIEERDFDLHALIATQHTLFQARAAERGLELRFAVTEDVPKRVVSDETRIAQLLLNLVGNALKFTEQGSVSVQVSAKRLDPQSSAVRFEITDTGIGLSQDTITQLFQPFAQADGSTTRKYGGTGLGLSICKRLIERMQGEIGVDSQKDIGSTFWFVLHLKHGQDQSTLAEIAPIEKTSFQGMHVLVAEDNPVNQLILRKILAKLGCTIELAANGSEALQAVIARPIDVVMMDCQMPVMDGFEATQAIRQYEASTGKNTYIIAVTANALSDDVQRCLYPPSRTRALQLLRLLDGHLRISIPVNEQRWRVRRVKMRYRACEAR
jgi:CheY-like chemotaxis protein